MTMTKSQTPITLTAAELQTASGGLIPTYIGMVQKVRESAAGGAGNFLFGDGSVKF